MRNPFTISFGKKPSSYITRDVQLDEVIDDFLSGEDSNQVCILTGLQGIGKTVSLVSIAEEFDHYDDWIVIRLCPDQNLLMTLAAELYENHLLTRLFQNAKIDISVLGIGLHIEGAVPSSDLPSALKKMFAQVKKAGKSVLITIDEAVSNDQMSSFCSQFQIWMGQNYPVFLLMTGLNENIQELMNRKG